MDRISSGSRNGPGPLGQLKGPPEPINDRLRLRLLVSEQLLKRRGIGTTRDKVERHLEKKHA